MEKVSIKEELKAVGLNIKDALAMRIPADVRRETKHKENIETLKEYLSII